MPCFLKRVLQFETAVTPVPDIVIYDRTGTDMTAHSSYAWSSDGVCWTCWNDYKTFLRLASNVESDFYLRVLIDYDFDRLEVNGVPTTCYTIRLYSEMPFQEVICGDPSLFNPYASLDCALLLQQQLADSIICMLGIPVYYFRVDPDHSTADLTFKDFTLHDIVACKQLKLMVEDGQMPSSNPRLTDLEFDWELDWEVELSKTQFAQAFGDTVFPKARDFLYIPLMKRMWTVNAAYDEKSEGLMWRTPTWKLSLVKYNEMTSYNDSELDSIIDSLIEKPYEEVFGRQEKLEQERTTSYNQIQSPSAAQTNLYNVFQSDAVRLNYTPRDTNIANEILCHHNNVVARNKYQFFNPCGAVTYQAGYCGESGAIIMVIKTQMALDSDWSGTIFSVGPISLELAYDSRDGRWAVGSGDLLIHLTPHTTYALVYRWDRSNFVRELVAYKHIHRTDLPVTLLRPEQYWFDLENPAEVATGPYNPDYTLAEPSQPAVLRGYPLEVYSAKLYTGDISLDECAIEATKYTTTNPKCILADLARPIYGQRGFVVR